MTRPAAQYLRHFRVVADDWQPRDGTGRLQAALGHHLTETAERELRARLERGERPDAMLVAPERATAEPILPGGRATARVFAWLRSSDYGPTWMHAPHALGELWAPEAEPDPVCPDYAAHGSVRLTGARLARVTVAPWLAPVADSLRDRYGVPIIVGQGDDAPAPDVQPGPAGRLEGALPPNLVRRLLDHVARQPFDPGTRLLAEAGPAVPVPEWLHPWLGSTFDLLAQAYRLPVDHVSGSIVAYEPGESAGEHVDAGPALARTLDRTVSLTAMLTEPGEDFTGGQLRVNGQPIELRAGDVVGFTAATPHEVTPVESGERLVVVAFGEVAR